MNAGPSDILKGIELALAIYQRGFVAENAAGVRYGNFRDEIWDLASLLQKLNRSLQRAHDRYSDHVTNRGPMLGLGLQQAHDPLSAEFEQERKALVGNFTTTLKECESVLKENRKYEVAAGARSNPISSLQWYLTQQEVRVEDLKRRLHFHAEKIRFVIDRLKLDLLTDLDAKADDLLGRIEETIGRADDIHFELRRFRSDLFGYLGGQLTLEELSADDRHIASEQLAARFRGSLSINAPGNVAEGVPLVPGFDALLLHYQESIRGDQTAENYVLFLKTRWLIARIKEGTEFQNARPGLYLRRAVNQVEKAILVRVRSPDMLISYDEGILLTVQESYFRIWPSAPATALGQAQQRDHLLPKANEEQVARIELCAESANERSYATIFKSSDSQLRIVQESQIGSEKVIVPRKFDTRQDVMIPRYALPSLESPCLEIAIFSRNEEILYSFKSLPELWKFQAALVGHDVSYDQSEGRVRCAFGHNTALPVCEGRVQLWQDPLVLSLDPHEAHRDSAISLGSSGPSNGGRGSLVLSDTVTSTVRGTDGGWEGRPIKPAALVIFTQVCDPKTKQNRFATIYLELQSGISLLPQECSCETNYDGCSNLFIGKTNGQRLDLRVSYSCVDTNGQPDPNSFDLFPYRLPRSPAFRKMSIVPTEHVILKFSSLGAKKRFHHELNERFILRNEQIAERRKIIADLRQRQDHPERLERRPTQSVPRSATSRSSISLASNSPPRLAMPNGGPSLAEAMAMSERRRQSNQSAATSLSTSPASTSTGIEDTHNLTRSGLVNGSLRRTSAANTGTAARLSSLFRTSTAGSGRV